MNKNNLPQVTIIGRVNVGKSTLFNKIVEKRQAMISDIPGTTRDLNIGIGEWSGIKFELVDTGGFIESINKKQLKNQENGIDELVRLKALDAFQQSDLVLFLVDVKEGINPQDKEIARFLEKSNKKFILIINKCDNPKLRAHSAEFYQLGLGEPVLVSAANGSGTGDLLDEIVKSIKQKNKKTKKTSSAEASTGKQNNKAFDNETMKQRNNEIEENTTTNNDKINPQEKNLIRVSIIGQPNVGKSSLINQLIGEDKFIVSPIAHATREPNDTLIEYQNNQILLIDTAGIRKKRKINPQSLEKLGVMMSLGALKKSDIVLLTIDISQPISDQDANLARIINESNTGAIIIANKYDLAQISRHESDKDSEFYKNPIKHLTNHIYSHLPHLSWAPIIFISAKTGSNVQKVLKLILDVRQSMGQHIGENALGKFLKSLIKKQPPPKIKTAKKRPFITNFEQAATNPPLFIGYLDTKERLPQAYRRYIEKNLREKFNFQGSPIKLIIKYKDK